MGGWGGGKGGSKGAMMGMIMQMMLKGKGGGKGKGWGRGGSGGGGWTLYQADAAKKVWIGGVTLGDGPSTDLNKQLHEHMKQAGDCKFATVGKSGTGGAVFATEVEAQIAISSLNGSAFNGGTIEVDVWTKKDS